MVEEQGLRLIDGASDVGVEVMHDVVWVVVDILIIVVSGATGGYLLRGGEGEWLGSNV